MLAKAIWMPRYAISLHAFSCSVSSRMLPAGFIRLSTGTSVESS